MVSLVERLWDSKHNRDPHMSVTNNLNRKKFTLLFYKMGKYYTWQRNGV